MKKQELEVLNGRNKLNTIFLLFLFVEVPE